MISINQNNLFTALLFKAKVSKIYEPSSVAFKWIVSLILNSVTYNSISLLNTNQFYIIFLPKVIFEGCYYKCPTYYISAFTQYDLTYDQSSSQVSRSIRLFKTSKAVRSLLPWQNRDAPIPVWTTKSIGDQHRTSADPGIH